MTDEVGTAFVLRTWPLRESDLIVSAFTREHGKIRGVAHGARRVKSRWAGALDPLTEVELRFQAKEGQDLFSLKSEVSILRSPYHPMPELAVAWTLAFLAELVDETAPAHDADDALYRLVRASVDALLSGVDPLAVSRYAETWVLRLHGVMPDSTDCVACGRSLADEGGTWLWDAHGLACPRCASSHSQQGPVLLPEDIAFLDDIKRQPPSQASARSPASGRRLGAFLARLLHEFLGRELKSAKFLAEIERFQP